MASDSYNYWIEMAEYDFQTAIAMYDTQRYLYVGFMLHQTIEKAFKGYYALLNSAIPPFTHSLVRLAQEGQFYNDIPEELKDLIDILEPLNIQVRYPSHKERLISELSEVFCKGLIEQTEVLYKWLIGRLQK